MFLKKQWFWGTIFTLVLLITLIDVVHFRYLDLPFMKSKEVELSPNELGDTLAGFAGVLAFFWLVLGYFQQGQELNENRKELIMQREALEGQVDALIVHANQAELDNYVKVLPIVTERLDNSVVRVALNLNGDRVSRINAGKYNTTLEELSFDYILNNLDLQGEKKTSSQRSRDTARKIDANCRIYIKNYEIMINDIKGISGGVKLEGVISRSRYRNMQLMMIELSEIYSNRLRDLDGTRT